MLSACLPRSAGLTKKEMLHSNNQGASPAGRPETPTCAACCASSAARTDRTHSLCKLQPWSPSRTALRMGAEGEQNARYGSLLASALDLPELLVQVLLGGVAQAQVREPVQHLVTFVVRQAIGGLLDLALDL